jgi:hypothetical protein
MNTVHTHTPLDLAEVVVAAKLTTVVLLVNLGRPADSQLCGS